MDVHLLLAERQRIAEQFRSTLTCLAMLRAQLIAALTDEARQHLLAILEEESAVSRDLSAKLLELDASILEIQTHESAQRRSPLLSAPLDFVAQAQARGVAQDQSRRDWKWISLRRV